MPKSKHAPKRTKRQVEKDRTTEADLYLKGWTQDAIAAHLHISRDMVQDDLAKVREAWLHSQIFDFDQAKSQKLMQIRLLTREAWEAWERSKQDFTKTKKSKTVAEGQDVKAYASSSNEQSRGEPRYLQIIKDLMDQENRLLGLYPDKHKTDILIDVPGVPTGETKVVYLPAWSEPMAKPEGSA